MDAFATTFDKLGIVGSRFREDVASQVQAAVLSRRGRDAVRLAGLTGTGKELVSSLVHEVARCELGRDGEIVEINCGNLSDSLFESSLFGHKRGAFTGANADQAGLLEKAKGGTLVLDEVQNLSLDSQGRLLRLIGEREYRPVGSTSLKRTDALIVLVSNLDLVALTRDGRFRRDLLDRAPAKINLLPLWSRREDISELATTFAREAAGDRGWTEFEGPTRRALADLEGALVEHRETSVRRLRELVRDAVFAFEGQDPISLESSAFSKVLRDFYGAGTEDRDAWDRADIEERFDLAIEAQTVARIAELHALPQTTLLKLARVLRELHGSLTGGEKPVPSSYRNLMARTSLATKAALWLLSGARNQSEFRRFFGTNPHEMPPKSVAWQIYHDVFGSLEETSPPGTGEELN
ncbi:sigma 54-interacting transcriptional regulator [Vulgatibacter incomptus]|uniref:Sigma-54 dependent DNA-binding response regulator n=1 Tax=Vulgatibacter incomptus TaxID=1391653 RepID=A0A0K1PF78_9BACT|nr:sigma 54-interacting transcriptional regulator [Vulgatibacter incomptus]AKU92188.1 Sigma-54 dependent DNA-binding response regulator [Vulgatibacter incomptus]